LSVLLSTESVRAMICAVTNISDSQSHKPFLKHGIG
jgi:hypothetical protein